MRRAIVAAAVIGTVSAIHAVAQVPDVGEVECVSAWCPVHGQVSCDHTHAATPTSGRYAQTDPRVQALAPAAQQIFNMIGNELAKSIFGDPAEKARQLELARQLRLREVERERLAAAERKRRQDEIHKKLVSEAMLTTGAGTELQPMLSAGTGKLEPMTALADDGDLRPTGTSFFSLGGGSPLNLPPVVDAPPVDLRHLGMAAFLARSAADALPVDAELLLDEAVRVTSGTEPFITIDGSALPVVSDAQLLAFRRADEEYRRAHGAATAAERRRLGVERRAPVYAEAEARVRARPTDPVFAQVMAGVRGFEQDRRKAEAEVDAAVFGARTADVIRKRRITEIVVPSPLAPDVLKREREWMEPGIVARTAHEGPLETVRRYFSSHADEKFGAEYGFVVDREAQTRIEAIVARLVAVSPYPGERYVVRILEDPRDPAAASGAESDAVTMGDSIYVGRRLLAKSDAELTAILAHEIGHLQRDHNAKRLLPMMRAEFVDVPETGVGIAETDRARIVAIVRDAHRAHAKREHEEEADRYGTALLVTSRGQPQGVRDMLHWIHDEEVRRDERKAAVLRDARLAKIPVERRAEAATRMTELPPSDRQLFELTPDHPPARERYRKLRSRWGPLLPDW